MISAKVGASALAGAIVAIAVWAAQQWGHVTVPGDVSSAATVIVSAIVGYYTPHQQGAT